MANISLPIEERDLTPDQVEKVDKRRRRGLLLLVISVQFAIIAGVLLLWAGQDWTYSPGFAHPMVYYLALAILISTVSGITGMVLRRGAPEF